MLTIILFILGLFFAILLANGLLKKYINDSKKRTLWLFVTDAILCLLAVIAFLFYLKWVRAENEAYYAYMNESPYQNRSERESYSINEVEVFDGFVMKMKGYLEAENGKHYDIEMVLNVSDEEDLSGLNAYGYYRYLSQPEDKKINLEGNLFREAHDLSQVNLYSENETERFSLSFAMSEDDVTGSWYQFRDKVSFNALDWEDQYLTKMKVIMSYEINDD